MDGKQKNWIHMLLVMVAFIALNLFSYRVMQGFKFDFTDDQRYSLSNETIHVVQSMKEPVTIRLFYSNSHATGIPFLKSYAERVKSFLRDYESYSGGLIQVKIIDPKPFSEAEELALSYGMKGAEIDKQGTKLYFGIAATNDVDDIRVIPILSFDREKFTEYELTRMVYDLSNPRKKKIGVLSSLKVGPQNFMGLPGLFGSKPWLVMQQLEHIFDVSYLDTETKTLPNDLDVLVVIQPDDSFDDDVYYALDQYVLAGNKTVFFLDPHAETKGGNQNSDNGFSRKMLPIIERWGINLSPDVTIADRLAARKVVDQESKKGHVDYIGWLELQKNNMNADDITTALIRTLNMASVGFITPTKDVMNVMPLIQSSRQAMRVPVRQMRGIPDPNRLLANFRSEDRAFTLAARVGGLAQTAFLGKSGAGHLARSVEPIQIVIVADTDVLTNKLWAKEETYDGHKIINPHADNAAFVVNVIDHLAGASELIALRGRGSVARPFTVVKALKRQAEERYLTKEKQLQAQLTQTERMLASLQKEGLEQGNRMTYKVEQQQEIKRFSALAIKVKKELRVLQQQLHADIKSLGSVIKVLNIMVVPMLVMIGALVYFWRRKRRYYLR